MTESGYGGHGALLAVSHRARMVIAGLLAPTPIAVLGFGFLYFARARTRTYAIGGLTSGLTIASIGLIGPFAGRIADRRGQRQLLLVSAVLGAPVYDSSAGKVSAQADPVGGADVCPSSLSL